MRARINQHTDPCSGMMERLLAYAVTSWEKAVGDHVGRQSREALRGVMRRATPSQMDEFHNHWSRAIYDYPVVHLTEQILQLRRSFRLIGRPASRLVVQGAMLRSLAY